MDVFWRRRNEDEETDMVITAYRSDAKESLVADEPPVAEESLLADAPASPVPHVEDRPRDALGHCWDGQTCDHPDHDTYATIHFIR
jgi:hypothetical protein